MSIYHLIGYYHLIIELELLQYDIISLINSWLTIIIVDSLNFFDLIVKNRKQWNTNPIHILVGGGE